MTQQKHTDGPWEVGEDCGTGQAMVTYQARDICRVEMAFGDGKANAALIAAAPGLESELEECVKIIEELNTISPFKVKRIASARRALAAARGERQP